MPAPKAFGNCSKCCSPYKNARALRNHYMSSPICDPKRSRHDPLVDDIEDPVLQDTRLQESPIMHTAITLTATQEEPSSSMMINEQNLECELCDLLCLHYYVLY